MTDEHKRKTADMIAVMQAYVDGKPIEQREFNIMVLGPWMQSTGPTWDWPHNEYRIATIPDSINWDHVSPEFNWMARDQNGIAFLFQSEPSIEDEAWQVQQTYCSNATSHRSYVRGTVDWKDSLVRRPS